MTTARKPRRKAQAEAVAVPAAAAESRAAADTFVGKAADAPTTRLVALAALAVAPENARAGRKADDVDGLAANIARYGLLQPLVGYERDGVVYVVDGRRRLAACAKAGLAAAPVIVRDAGDAIEASLAANTQRTDMHPADEAIAWSKMIADGVDKTAIANAFGKTERYVDQRLKLAGLHAPILAALGKDQIGLDVAECYAGAPADRQAALWKRLGKNAHRWAIRRELEKGAIGAEDALARFVGEKAYVAAGGRIERDLFSERGSRDDLWLDRGIVEKLAAEKLEASAERLRKEGWGFVEVKDSLAYGLPTDLEAAAGKPAKSKAAKAERGCLVARDAYNDRLVIRRDLVKRRQGRPRGQGGREGQGGAAGAAPEMTHRSHEICTRIASAVVGIDLMKKPAAMAAVLCGSLARTRFADAIDPAERDSYTSAQPCKLATRSIDRDDIGSKIEVGDIAPAIEDETVEREGTWLIRLQEAVKAGPSLEEAIFAWPAQDQLELLAFLVAPSIRVVELHPHRNDKHADARRGRLGAIGRLVGADPGRWWTPDAAWFKGLSKPALEAVADELGVTPKPKTKGKLAEACAGRAAEQRWAPELVRTMTGRPAATAKAAAPSPSPAKAKRKRKAKAA